MSDPRRDAIVAAAQQVAVIWKQMIGDEHIDWDTMKTAVEAVCSAFEEGCTKMRACPFCGCTDIESVDWVHVNSKIPRGDSDDSHRENNWCPQCETHFPCDETGPPVVGVARPYDSARDLDAENLVIPEEYKA